MAEPVLPRWECKHYWLLEVCKKMRDALRRRWARGARRQLAALTLRSARRGQHNSLGVKVGGARLPPG